MIELPDLKFREGISDLFLTLDSASDFFSGVCWNEIPKHKCSDKCPYFIKRVSVCNKSTSQMLLCKRDPERVEAVRSKWRRRNAVGGANHIMVDITTKPMPQKHTLVHNTAPTVSVADDVAAVCA